MFKSALIAFALVAGAAQASATTGFDIGNDFQAVTLYGSATVTCPSRWGGYQTSHFNCTGEILNPYEFARFVTDDKADADAVELKAIHEDGSSRTKAGAYSSSKSRSETFNLWIRTLTQKPLLEFGVNKIAYTMKKNKAVVSQGTFTATVTDGGDRSCRHDSWWSQNPNDCETGATVCDRLFQMQNYCE